MVIFNSYVKHNQRVNVPNMIGISISPKQKHRLANARLVEGAAQNSVQQRVARRPKGMGHGVT